MENGGGKDISDQMSDPRYDSETGSVDKVVDSHHHGDGTTTEVHADRDRETGDLSDVKFKDQPNSRSRKYPQ